MADQTPKDENPTTQQPVAPLAASIEVPPAAEEAPDPDEDDLSDLDDVLDEFAATKLDTKPTAPTSSGPGRPAAADVETKSAAAAAAAAAPLPAPNLASPVSSAEEEEFAKLMQAGMADLLGGLETSPDMQKQFEQMMRELDNVAASDGPEAEALRQAAGITKEDAAAAAASSAAKPGSDAARADSSFQETIKRTMERMQESGEAAGAAAASSSKSDEDFMAKLLRELETGGGGGDGSDDDFSKMLMGIMEQLTNKDILYEPMKEMNDKFPDWMEKNKGKHSDEDMKRYAEQQTLASEIVAKFEEPDYSDDKVEYRQYIVDRMQRMQAAGSPPADLVGDMAAAQEALGELDSGCPQQ